MGQYDGRIMETGMKRGILAKLEQLIKNPPFWVRIIFDIARIAALVAASVFSFFKTPVGAVIMAIL
jgi:hypothetical protein